MTLLFAPRRRFSPWLVLVAGLITFFAFYGLVYAAVDPLGTAQTSVDVGVGLVATYGPVLGGMYLLYQLTSRLVAKYASSSWFAKGKRLAIATGALGIAGAALQAQVVGSPWNVIVMAAIAAAFKLITPTVTPTSGPTASGPTASGSTASDGRGPTARGPTARGPTANDPPVLPASTVSGVVK
jgi:hypothetical protein